MTDGDAAPADEPATGGRIDPRITRSRAAILSAALSVLAERGYGSFTIEAVASRAGVARSTVYRLWPDPSALIGAAYEELNTQPDRPPDASGSPRDHVVAIVRHLTEVMASPATNDPPLSACLPALIDGAERDAALARMHHAYSDRRWSGLVRAITDAVTAGEVRELDPELAATALAGAVFYRRLMSSAPLAPASAPDLVQTVLGPPPTTS